MESLETISARKVAAVFVLLLQSFHYQTFASIQSIRGRFEIWWHAPFFSFGGYSSEAFAVMSSLYQSRDLLPNCTLGISHHGDSYSQSFIDGLSEQDYRLMRKLSMPGRPARPLLISVCHSEPGAWHAPTPRYHTSRCPPEDSLYTIGRTMFETDRIPDGWPARLEFMDEIWVPTEFSRQAFLRSGELSEDKIRVVGEPVNTDFYAPIHSSVARLTVMQWAKHHVVRDSKPNEAREEKAMELCFHEKTSLFLFVGKWEKRKGVESLLSGYFEAFQRTAGELDSMNVCLLLLTSAYHSTEDFEDKIAAFLKSRFGNEPVDNLPTHMVLTGVPQAMMPAVYSAADVLVIPSHGEGWGRPHVEAMSCGRPVIATNWSGPTAYLTEANGFPLRYNGLIEAENWKGHFWADPDVSHLTELLRFAAANRDVCHAKGRRAREDMKRQFSYQIFGEILVREFARVTLIVEKRFSQKILADATNEGLHGEEL